MRRLSNPAAASPSAAWGRGTRSRIVPEWAGFVSQNRRAPVVAERWIRQPTASDRWSQQCSRSQNFAMSLLGASYYFTDLLNLFGHSRMVGKLAHQFVERDQTGIQQALSSADF